MIPALRSTGIFPLGICCFSSFTLGKLRIPGVPLLTSPHPLIPRLPTETTSDQKPGTNPPRSQRPAQPWGQGGRGARLRHHGDTHGDNARASVGSGRITRPLRKKPDKALYVPKGIRKKANWRERESSEMEPGGDAAPGGEKCPKNSIRDTQQEEGKDGNHPGRQQEPGEESVPGKSGAEHPLCEEKVPSLGNSNNSCELENQDKDCSHSVSSGHNKNPHEAEEQDPSHANTAIPEGREFQSHLREENQPRQDSGGPECGKSSFPLENHGGSWTDPAVAESPALDSQSLESSRNKSLPGDQDSRNAEGGRSSSTKIQEQESPSTAQVEQNPLQNIGEGPGEALAAPELLRGADPAAPEGAPKAPTEEEEDKEHSDVAEALWRGLDLAAGDREGTRHSGLEDDCTAELLAEVGFEGILGKEGQELVPGRRFLGGAGGVGVAEVRIGL